jgi:2Fe-2S ferredoxin
MESRLMTTFNIITREGVSAQAEISADQSVMEAIRDKGIDELQALCGGQLSCATCHVYVDADHADRLPAMAAFESELLDSSDFRTDLSRLSCQIVCSPELDGMTVTIAPEN